MKKISIISIVLAGIILCSSFTTSTLASAEDVNTYDFAEEPMMTQLAEVFIPPEYETDYMWIMIQAAICGDVPGGREAATKRNEKIGSLMLSDVYPKIDFDELYLLAKIMYAEAGSYWLSDEWKMCVGEVVLNRVASSEFPNTVYTVLTQKGQYYGANSTYFNNLLPSEKCVTLAQKLLEGERELNNSSVVFQANFKQGSGVHKSFYDQYLGWTYFCYSSYPGLY